MTTNFVYLYLTWLYNQVLLQSMTLFSTVGDAIEETDFGLRQIEGSPKLAFMFQIELIVSTCSGCKYEASS